MRLKVTRDELTELKEWVDSPSFKLFSEKVLPQLSSRFVDRLATSKLDRDELLINKAKLDGVKEFEKNIQAFKALIKGQGDDNE